MRILLPVLLIVPSGCNVANDPDKDQVTVRYDEARIKKSAADTARAAKAVGTGVAHIAKGTARVVKDEVGDVDVDVKVSRTRPEPRPTEARR
ncbi:hypothetical protein [Novosphingobium sp. Gsoil 351]|uniref:hypothetical protein n=1 Tax=Novosphingobium sp. Gsoil 351 TaxID=2675225 RepID=UPI0012B4C40A|nr:hypothetical protein [Novosphingobium sp. Gsoil 351]QGN55038.1 hypothetical protein GKE62_11195 [Novosphingobium sp. Gsoil 351]